MSTYEVTKQSTPKNIEQMYLLFDNGEYVGIHHSEIRQVSLCFYDRLEYRGRSFAPVAHSGCIRLRIQQKYAKHEHAVADECAFHRDPRAYIARLCTQGSLKEVWCFDQNHWHLRILCRASATMEEDCLVLHVLPQPWMGPHDSDRHRIELPPLRKHDIERIDIDFENCDGFTVFADEIRELNLCTEPLLKWNATAFCRTVRSGYMILSLNAQYDDARHADIYGEKGVDPSYRLCGDGETDVCDICHLYITYAHPGYGCLDEECIDLPDIATAEMYDEETELFPFVSGYSRRLADGRILLTFGPDTRKPSKQDEGV